MRFDPPINELERIINEADECVSLTRSAYFYPPAIERIRDGLVRLRYRLQKAVDSQCTCDGVYPDACPACRIWHMAVGSHGIVETVIEGGGEP